MAEEGAKKNVVVVGGGHAGAGIARELSKKLDASQYNLILVTPRSFFVHLIAMARIPVSGADKLEDRALFGYEKLFINGNGSVKVGKVVAVNETEKGKGGEVVLEDVERIPYATLVVATGSTWPGVIELPNTDSDARAQINSWREKIKKAQHVVIVGGGAVGIELAGEIREEYSDKKITVIHRANLLLNSVYPDKFRKDVERRLRVRNVEVVLDDAIEDLSETPSGVTTKSGKSIPDADLVVRNLCHCRARTHMLISCNRQIQVRAFGATPNTTFLKSLGDDVLNDSGRVKVNEFLEVAGHPGVFALGDIIDWKEEKQAAKIAGQSAAVIANLYSFLAGVPSKKAYKGSTEAIIIPLGKTGGAGWVGFFGGIMLGDWVAKNTKGKDLFVKMSRSQFGL
ncbi:FAD/NAD-P-binding domain-containing protein [Fomes fomentarius]|nr:FAD/NAD-P-binding domain-containing protein [Fomes fomentarius]